MPRPRWEFVADELLGSDYWGREVQVGGSLRGPLSMNLCAKRGKTMGLSRELTDLIEVCEVFTGGMHLRVLRSRVRGPSIPAATIVSWLPLAGRESDVWQSDPFSQDNPWEGLSAAGKAGSQHLLPQPTQSGISILFITCRLQMAAVKWPTGHSGKDRQDIGISLHRLDF